MGHTTIAFSIKTIAYRFTVSIIASIIHIMRQMITIGRYFCQIAPPSLRRGGGEKKNIPTITKA